MSAVLDKPADAEIPRRNRGKGTAPASLANLKPFQPGNNANPGGKPIKSRNKLQGDFMRELADAFEVHGKKALVTCATEKPVEFIKVCASLMPKEVEMTTNTLDELSDEALAAAIETVQAMLAAKGEKLPA